MSPLSQANLDEYAKPVIADYGTITANTASNATGRFTDAAFPAQTPFEELTFS